MSFREIQARGVSSQVCKILEEIGEANYPISGEISRGVPENGDAFLRHQGALQVFKKIADKYTPTFGR